MDAACGNVVSSGNPGTDVVESTELLHAACGNVSNLGNPGNDVVGTKMPHTACFCKASGSFDFTSLDSKPKG